MVPYIRAMAVEREGWLTEPGFRLGMSLAQIIPGATAMQVAAYVGLRSRGGAGALAAYAGFGLPAFLLMVALSVIYFSARELAGVQHAFAGLQLVVVALVLNAAIDFARAYLDSMASKVLACAAGIWLGLHGNPILALAAVCGVSVFLFTEEQGAEGADVPPVPGHPLRAALVFLLCLTAFMAVLHAVSPRLFSLGLLMIRIDCFAFGGGYVSVPLMLHEVVEVAGWLTSAQFMDGIALGQVTPGPIVMTGAFVGYALAGFIGALVATITVFAPSLILLCAATPFADRLVASPVARRVLKGSLISLVGLMAGVAARFGLAVDWDPPRLALALAALVALRLRIDILKVVLAGAAAGAVIL
jgi:chromate transporter